MLAIALLTLLAPVTPPTTQASTQPSQWKLVWSDEFNQPGKPDVKKWSYERGFVRNHELQFYTEQAANVRVERGVLVIEARHEVLDTHDGKHAN